MYIKPPTGVLTVKKLREYLDEMEASYTDDDVKYLGEFEYQRIHVLHDSSVGGGVGDSQIIFDGGLDFILLPKDHDEAIKEELEK